MTESDTKPQTNEELEALCAQRAELDGKIQGIRNEKRSIDLQTVKKLVQEHNFNVGEVFNRRHGNSAKKVAPKYRDPATGKTWTGRGKTPRWLVGKSLEEFAI